MWCAVAKRARRRTKSGSSPRISTVGSDGWAPGGRSGSRVSWWTVPVSGAAEPLTFAQQSAAVNLSYSSRFNWAHGQVGRVFQGRFKAVVIRWVRGVGEVVRYVHWYTVRIQGLGLGKAEQRRTKVQGCEDPGAALLVRRLQVLADYPWNSWRAYPGDGAGGAAKSPAVGGRPRRSAASDPIVPRRGGRHPVATSHAARAAGDLAASGMIATGGLG